MPTSRRRVIKRKHAKGQIRAKRNRPQVKTPATWGKNAGVSKGKSRKAAKRGRGKTPSASAW